jgi:hypothetical protein
MNLFILIELINNGKKLLLACIFRQPDITAFHSCFGKRFFLGFNIREACRIITHKHHSETRGNTLRF